jgi:hypothetical protein
MVGVREIVGDKVIDGVGVWVAVGVMLGSDVAEGVKEGVGVRVAVQEAVGVGEAGTPEKISPPQPAKMIVLSIRNPSKDKNLNRNLKIIVCSN